MGHVKQDAMPVIRELAQFDRHSGNLLERLIFNHRRLVLFLVPLMAWWLDISLLEALIADLAILAFFFVYAIVFTWAFDRVFGLPESAKA